jgi:hypothetical protein
MRFRDLVDELVQRVYGDGELDSSAELTIRVPRAIKLTEQIVESRWQKHDNQYRVRLDKRPANQGGDQIHIQKRDGSEWAYRHTGERSEPRKYTLQATQTVRDIVRSVFNLPSDQMIEVIVIQADQQQCLVEIVLDKAST